MHPRVRSEVCAVEGAVNAQSGGEAARTAREIEQAGGLAVALHLPDARERFERAEQDAAADSGDFRADVEHEMIAVVEIDVGVATAEKHGAIAGGGAPKGMSGGVGRRGGVR